MMGRWESWMFWLPRVAILGVILYFTLVFLFWELNPERRLCWFPSGRTLRTVFSSVLTRFVMAALWLPLLAGVGVFLAMSVGQSLNVADIGATLFAPALAGALGIVLLIVLPRFLALPGRRRRKFEPVRPELGGAKTGVVRPLALATGAAEPGERLLGVL